MELAPRYCRTCGSRILVKHICHNCNSEPLKGDNYCYNCGALTPNADGCLKCGARYKRSSPAKPLLLGVVILFVISVAAYFVLNSDSTPQVAHQKNNEQAQAVSQTSEEIPSAQKPVINNPVDTSHTAVPTSAVIKTDTVKQTHINTDSLNLTKQPIDSANIKKPEINIFSPDELKAYKSRCSYFSKNQRSQVMFLISGTSAFIKMSSQIIELKRKRKGTDAEVFAGSDYEAILTIDGLSGSDKEWLASCTLLVKNITANTSVKHKVYSSCIEL